MRGWGAWVAGAALLVGSGCTSVKMVQRDGCWVKQTNKWPGQVREELGFCGRQPSKPAEDRLARLVQECMSQADFRWQNRALAAWSRNEPLPPQESEQATLNACMNQAATSSISENENLRARLAELNKDRDSLQAVVDTDQAHLRESHDRIADALGEAAKKPAPSATATATSNGTATTTSTTKSDQSAQPATASVEMVPAPTNNTATTQQGGPIAAPMSAPANGPAPVQAAPIAAPAQASANHPATAQAAPSAAPTPSCTMPSKKVQARNAPKTRPGESAPACPAPAKSPAKDGVPVEEASVTAALSPKPEVPSVVAPEPSRK